MATLTDHEYNLLLTLLTKWQEEESTKRIEVMNTDVVLNCTHLILELQKRVDKT